MGINFHYPFHESLCALTYGSHFWRGMQITLPIKLCQWLFWSHAAIHIGLGLISQCLAIMHVIMRCFQIKDVVSRRS